jgi:TPR repeat protein
MMKRLFCAIAFGVSGLVSAGQLEDANQLLAAKQYDKAFATYGRLADGGNTEAQFRLGEMYWYGDGTAPDINVATTWLQKAAQRGHAGAIESLAILKQRETRGADIAYWTSGYKGQDLVSGRFDCRAPLIAATSVTTEDVKHTAAAYNAWKACYDGFAENIKSVPLGKRIPADVARLMTPREAEQALAHLNRVVDGIVATSNDQALAVSARYIKWQGITEREIANNRIASQLEYEVIRRHQDEARVRSFPEARPVNLPPPQTPNPAPKM